jgi:hypothetical protein
MINYKNIIFMAFAFFAVIFTAAIPEAFKPYSLADLILIALAPILIIYYNKKIILFLIFGLLTFLLVTLFARIREFNVSEITSISLILKWAGVVFVYYAITKNIKPKINILIFITLLQLIVMVSVLFDIKPLPESYYGGSSGVFQASADGGYYILCMLGVFLHLFKINKSKLIYFNIFISLITLLLIDSRFGTILGFLAVIYNLFLVAGGRIISIILFAFLSLLLIFDIISIPHKLSELLFNTGGIGDLFGSDVSMLIRLNNFDEAFKMSDYWTIFFGNGGKFFQLMAVNFYNDNVSLDNTYLYLILSFGIVGLFVFYIIFISKNGLSMGNRGALTFLILAFPLMQDVFSNSFNLLTLGITVAIDTILYKYYYQRKIYEERQKHYG